jgi:AraC-like DNA-binding protein
MLHRRGAGGGDRWSSHGLPPGEALRRWKNWASSTLAPMHIEVPDERNFAARWTSRAVGPLQMIALEATDQRIVHMSEERNAADEPMFQLLYCTRAPIEARIGAKHFVVGQGEFTLVDNTQSYDMRMGAHKAIDLVIPRRLLHRWLPDPEQYVAKPFSASKHWGIPLGSYLATMAREIDNAVLPASVIADQVGTLLALAVGYRETPCTKHKTALLQRALRLINDRQGNPELHPDTVASELGISKRYLQALLAEAGMTFVGCLTAARLDKASELLSDRRASQLQISDISLQCGYLDPSYFARAFRRRFGMGPREWRHNRRL